MITWIMTSPLSDFALYGEIRKKWFIYLIRPTGLLLVKYSFQLPLVTSIERLVISIETKKNKFNHRYEKGQRTELTHRPCPSWKSTHCSKHPLQTPTQFFHFLLHVDRLWMFYAHKIIIKITHNVTLDWFSTIMEKIEFLWWRSIILILINPVNTHKDNFNI